jgi:hypothetical protein
MVAYVLKVTLRQVQPAVWRRIRVPGDATLGELHDVLQISLGWNDSHLHAFRVGAKEYGPIDEEDDRKIIDEETITLDEIARKQKKLVYLYDFGDGWEHDVAIEKTVKDPTALECLDGGRAAPPDDCGGPPGFEELLAILANKKDRRHREMREWAGDFDPERFDIAAVNDELFEWVVRDTTPNEEEVHELAKTLAEALENDPEAMVTVRARVVAGLLGHLMAEADRER